MASAVLFVHIVAMKISRLFLRNDERDLIRTDVINNVGSQLHWKLYVFSEV